MRSSARAVVDGAMTEAELLAAVVDLAHLRMWMTYHSFDSRHSAAGFPDICAVRGHRLLFAELKSQRGRLTADQRTWLEALALTGAETYLWRPSDFEQIEETLR